MKNEFIAICTDDASPQPFCHYVDDLEYYKKRQQEIHAGNIDFVYVPLAVAIAAPELLEALKIASLYVSSVSDKEDWQIIQAAIQKATS